MTGVLAGLEDGSRVDLSAADYFIGTSAGAVVAARLAAGQALRRPDAPHSGGLEPAGAIAQGNLVTTLASTLGALPAQLALRAGDRAHGVSRRLALRAIRPRSESVDPLLTPSQLQDARFDGRLRVVTVCRATGRRVVFGSPGAPDASVADAVTASCSVPWLFAPAVINGVEYVDGGVWSSTSIDLAPAKAGSEVLCLAPRASTHGPLRAAMRVPVRAAALLEAAALRARGARVRLVAPDRDCARVMGTDFMAHEASAEILAAGYRQGLLL